jgi:hypothetical protein
MMFVADKTNLGNDGNGMPNKMNDCRREADPHKKVSGSTGTDSSFDPRQKWVKVGSGSCIAPINLSNAGPFI